MRDKIEVEVHWHTRPYCWAVFLSTVITALLLITVIPFADWLGTALRLLFGGFCVPTAAFSITSRLIKRRLLAAAAKTRTAAEQGTPAGHCVGLAETAGRSAR